MFNQTLSVQPLSSQQFISSSPEHSEYNSFLRNLAKKGVWQIEIIYPLCFNEIMNAVELLKQEKCVILNVNSISIAEGQRCVDFISGATFMLEGEQSRIGDGIFLFTPNGVAITNILPEAEVHTA